MSAESIAGTILVGGRSRRMVGRNKAFVPLGGEPLIRHVIDRVKTQVDALALSVESMSPALAAFDLIQLEDPSPGHQGPLGGLLSALRHFGGVHGWVLLVPCDAPFVPTDLATRLFASAGSNSLPGAVVIHRGELQPTFSIWHRSLLPDLERAVAFQGFRGFKELLRSVRLARCDCWDRKRSNDPPPFFNVNDETALEEAGRWLRRCGEQASSCSA